MLDESAVGLSVEQDFSYTWRDLILYNLSVGAKQEELEYVYERDLKAVPTFGVIPCTATFGTEPYSEQPLMPTKKIEGLRSDGTLHMDHKLVIHKPIPKEGKLHLEKVISAVYDRGEGKGAKINVDIIAKDGETLVFVEVKSRKNRAFGNPIDAVNPVKQKRLQFMARQYMAERELCHVNVRFDIVEILWGDTAKQAVKIHHVKNAF